MAGGGGGSAGFDAGMFYDADLIGSTQLTRHL
jgi:hypothetical protein